ncbi:phosphatidylglycerol lysyltransferase domain-containing protein [Microvirga sp. 2YAF29]|uniref:phosphatidylglycerol lysyltransferase domain-containing protein n=1 Tax=Microvirga sp. 2YAF29 TaxID=3233031 RepID=UPI003F962533
MNIAQRNIGLESLVPIEIRDADTFLAAADEAQVKAWLYYFPLLYFYGQFRAHTLRWERHAGSMLIYQIRRKEGQSRMDLYLPPFPFNVSALRYAQQRMEEFNGNRSGRIIWVQESDALPVARAGYEVFFREEEFIFDRAAVMGLEGSGFKKLRNKISGSLRQGHVDTRPYTAADWAACTSVLENWRERLIANGIAPNGYRYTRACLKTADRFPHELLNGLVVECDGEVRGFAFTGHLAHTLGCNFLCITDTNYRGLSYLLCYRHMVEFPKLIHFNDSSDTGRPGLRESKQLFRPIEMHGLYGAYMRQ